MNKKKKSGLRILVELTITLLVLCVIQLHLVGGYELEIKGDIPEELVLGGLSEYSAVHFIGLEKITFQKYTPYKKIGNCGTYYQNPPRIIFYGWDGNFPYYCLDHELGHHFEHDTLGKRGKLSEDVAKAYTPLKYFPEMCFGGY